MKTRKSSKKPSQHPLPLGADDFPLYLVRRLTEAGQGECDAQLARALLGSFSLSFHEKVRVVETRLSRFQHDELVKVFESEADEFATLYQEQSADVLKLISNQVFSGFMLGRYFGLNPRDDLEDALARRMVRRAVRRGVLPFLERLPESVWRDERLLAWLWRHALPADHPAWLAVPAAADGELASI